MWRALVELIVAAVLVQYSTMAATCPTTDIPTSGKAAPTQNSLIGVDERFCVFFHKY